MIRCFGTKQILAIPMDRAAYNEYRGWSVPADENPDDEGFLVEYVDGGQTNHPDHAGYISWSPKDVFEAAYQPVTAMNFGHALQALKEGYRVARAGWNGNGMFLALVLHWELIPVGDAVPIGASEAPFILIDNGQGAVVPWLASQTDMLAEDWRIVEGEA